MGPFLVQTQGMKELVIDRCDDLPDPREPAPQGLWPWGLPIPLGRTEDWGSVSLPPGDMMRLALKALIDDIGAQGWPPHTGHPRVGEAAQGKEGVGQGLVFGARRATGKAGNHPYWVDCQQEREACIPAKRLLQPISASPGSHPAPRRLASRVGTPVLSRAS
jgi:hypothetical protein